MKTTAVAIAVLAASLFVLAPGSAAAQDGTSDSNNTRIDVEAAQALLDIQHLDGWLMAQDRKANSIAENLVGPNRTTRAWFFWIPADGKPVSLVHRRDLAAFKSVPGQKVSYTSAAQIKSRLQKIVGEAKKIAMEYAPESGVASLTRVDPRTAKMVASLGVTVSSSAQLVQFTKSAWGFGGRISHYVAVHHLSKLVDEAIGFIGAKLSAGELITEFDVQQYILKGYQVRGLKGAPPIIATGISSADSNYVPSAANARVIKAGDVIQFDLSGHVATDARPIVANISWIAYVGNQVPSKLQKAFRAVAAARDATIGVIRTRMAERREIAGFEAAQTARKSLTQAGLVEFFTHSTGHSLDTSLRGDGANLEDLGTKDTRTLVVGSGFTIGPGVYFPGEFGVRSEVGVFLSAAGLEVTSRLQRKVAIVPIQSK